MYFRNKKILLGGTAKLIQNFWRCSNLLVSKKVLSKCWYMFIRKLLYVWRTQVCYDQEFHGLWILYDACFEALLFCKVLFVGASMVVGWRFDGGSRYLMSYCQHIFSNQLPSQFQVPAAQIKLIELDIYRKFRSWSCRRLLFDSHPKPNHSLYRSLTQHDNRWLSLWDPPVPGLITGCRSPCWEGFPTPGVALPARNHIELGMYM